MPKPHAIRPAAPLLAAFAACVAILLSACGSPSPARSGVDREEAGAVFAPPGRTPGQSASLGDTGWSVVLRAFSGSAAQQQAQAFLDALRRETSMPDARVQNRGQGKAAVVAGSFPSASDPAGLRRLREIREIRINDQRVFAGAFLAPPPSTAADAGAMPQYSLLSARREFGPRVQYTLQIGVYESPDLQEARRAAEQAVRALRAAGEPAFYYHGPSRSTVTVGAFTPDEIGAGGKLPSPALEALRREHPHNLLNGRTIIERSPGARPTEQRSFVVAIPD